MALRHLRRTLTTTATTTTNKLPILHTTTTSSSDDVTLQLLSWGRGSSGQLGTGNEHSQIYPSPISTLFVPHNSYTTSPPSTCQNDGGLMEISVVCGLFHSGAVVDGRLWIWGKGDGGRLGFGDEETVFRPRVNENVGKGGVRRVALGGLHSVAVDSLGDVYSWGYGGFGALGHKVYTRELSPKRVEGSWECRIIEIATSGTHTAAITEAGQLYTWGRDEGEGRLGLGPSRGLNEVGGLSIPTKVKALEVPVVSVACGGFFTTVITNDGKLWSWGANSNNELGRGNRVGGWKPQPIPSLEGVRIVQIASGGYHSLALTDDGRVLSWGYGGHGQLGHFSTQNQAVPTVIESLASEKVVYIACGGSSSAAVTDTGKLYMWGNAKDGQLGVPGVPEIQPFPIEVKFLRDDDGLGSHNVLSVAIGASHALCLVSR
ncbi:regulator of chromosome condensation (RCC1) family protein [Artemisia annua]|uniref:Regulator of chromosome condensation (RCC1) family protein n=1 Tax=Artemisia annua TaxID=35608 RepID=A0A2U1PH99_ARTAN|nr:regulator of chromosome condensation (RCC1) family protein [Artemisia annua]